MKLTMVLDYYVLMSLQVALAQGCEFDKPQERLRHDVDAVMGELQPALARRIRDYLVLACFGEARHAHHCTNGVIGVIPAGASRGQAAGIGLRYAPESSLPILSDLFHNYGWPGGYGGRAWGHIADFALEYGRNNDSFFIDHVVDLEHNGGCVFSKTTAGEHARLALNIETDQFKHFCDLKSQENLLDMAEIRARRWTGVNLIHKITTRIARLVQRYFRVVKREEPPDYWFRASEAWGIDDPADFGGWDLQDVSIVPRITCDRCGNAIKEGQEYTDDDNVYCGSCWKHDKTKCANCRRWTPDEDITLVWQTNGWKEPWCSSCVRTDTWACEHCDDLHADRVRSYDVDGETWCKACTDHDASECQECGDYAPDQDMRTAGTKWVCPGCYEDLMENALTCDHCGDSYPHGDVTPVDDGELTHWFCPACLRWWQGNTPGQDSLTANGVTWEDLEAGKVKCDKCGNLLPKQWVARIKQDGRPDLILCYSCQVTKLHDAFGDDQIRQHNEALEEIYTIQHEKLGKKIHRVRELAWDW